MDLEWISVVPKIHQKFHLIESISLIIPTAASGKGDTKTYASQIGEDLNLKPDFKNLDLEFGTLEQASIPAHVDNQILPSPTTTSSMRYA